MSKVTTVGQITIPKNVKKFLKIKVGDNIIFKLDGKKIIMESAET